PRPPPPSPPLPYTTLFRSDGTLELALGRLRMAERELHPAEVDVDVRIVGRDLRGLLQLRQGSGVPMLLHVQSAEVGVRVVVERVDRKSTRLNSSHVSISYA